MQADHFNVTASGSGGSSSSAALHTPQKRSALACLPCRTAKNKCDGVPPPLIAELSSHLETKMPHPTGHDVQLRSDHACTRCARLRLECLWQPSHRTGRPRKRARGLDSAMDVRRSSSQAPITASFSTQQPGMSQDNFAPAPHPSAFDSTTAMIMGLFEQSQSQSQSQDQDQDEDQDQSQIQVNNSSSSFAESISSFQLSESDLMALLNQSPFDSSRAAIEAEQGDSAMPQPPMHPSLPADRAPMFDPMQSGPLPDQLIVSLDQITPLSCPPPTYQKPTTTNDASSCSPKANLPAISSTGASSRARTQLSALRARLNPVSQSPPPNMPRAEKIDVPNVVHFREAKEMVLRYIYRTGSSPSVDDSVDTAVLDNGLKLYFSGFAKTVPLLGDMVEFQATVLDALPRQNNVRRLLSRIVATLGYLVSTANLVTENERNELLQHLRSEARTLSLSCLDRIESLPCIRLDDLEALAILQSLLLMAYDSYGQSQLSEAESTMRSAVNVALKMQLYRMDAPSQSNIHSARPALSESHAESLRRAWWELYLCDLMFTVTTSGKIARCIDTHNLEVAVHTPIDPGLSSLGRHAGMLLGGSSTMKAESSEEASADRHELSQAYDVRIRTCALIHESVKVPDNPNEPDFERIRAIDTMLSNIMIVAQRHWANASTHSNASRQNGTDDRNRNEDERLRWINDTRIELLFTSMTMLHASRIHLHRIAWFHDLTMDFTSCSFKKLDNAADRVSTAVGLGSSAPVAASPQSTAAGDARRQAMLSTSVTRIVSSADAIMRLVRLDQRMSSPSTWTWTNTEGIGSESDTQSYVAGRLPAHWPFLGCCNMVAAFGYVVAVAASGPDKSNLPTYGDEIRLYDEEDVSLGEETLSIGPSWQHQPFESSLPLFAASPTSPAAITTGAVSSNATTTTRRDAMVWKLRAAISNIGFAESTLSQYAHIWPICAVYQREVALCRDAIDSTGPTGLQ
ncbi:uncharacterized protein UTRI_04208_B [Ustilago trichophora]|uniref:Zn(2)-C6 fungal-type domain-containing protein n=1 Tax=Ustilago trichophora TaxID=86804 RepID=A0A5C3EAT1_9BASI|nr:uncharacterized protein UTRI_04208_B [Ustilago trichophora]